MNEEEYNAALADANKALEGAKDYIDEAIYALDGSDRPAESKMHSMVNEINRMIEWIQEQ